jgi:putative DNA primase/helicase
VRTSDDGNAVLERTPGNLALLLIHDPRWAGCLVWDELACRAVWRREPEAVPGLTQPSGSLIDEHYTWIQQAARRQYGVTWPVAAVQAAADLAAHSSPWHPVREYLAALAWDGQPRIDRWLAIYHGASEPTIPVERWWLVSAVARVLRPGCQADHCLILQGPQGAGKSTALRILAGPWYSGHLGDLRDKDGPQSLAGAWIVEIGELDALRGAASTRVKDFLSQCADRFRPSYGRCIVERPRQCVFAATTNEHEYLHDPSGARRFWPVSVGRLDREALERDRDQLWAEALGAYRAGERWWPVGLEEAEALHEEAEERYQSDPWEEPLSHWLCGRPQDEITMGDALGELEVPREHWDRPATLRVAAILRRAGWRRLHTRSGKRWARSEP